MFYPYYGEYFINNYSNVIINMIDKTSFSLLLKEIIIIDLITNYFYDSDWISSKEIQMKYEQLFLKNRDKLPLNEFEKYNNTEKTVLKQKLINITTSNANNSNGLLKRNELSNCRIDRTIHYKANFELINHFSNGNIGIMNQLLFFEKYKYIQFYNKVLNLDSLTNYCQLCGEKCSKIIIFNINNDKNEFFYPENTRRICNNCLEMKINKEVYII